jgi:holo-[acyl-carrier protein] synthase
VIGVGVDAVEVDRFRRVLARSPRLAQRLFTDGELAYAARRRDPAQPLAARFAAKEAVLKALGGGRGSARFAEIEVTRATSGAPALRLAGRAAALAAERGVARWHLSLTHTDVAAVAVALAE